MQRLSRYLVRAMVSMSLAVLATLIGLAALFTLADELRGTRQSTLDAALYTLLDVPRFLDSTLVVAMLAGCTIALALLARNNELHILQVGLGRRLLRAALLPGILATAAGVLNTEYLLPFAAGLEQERRFGSEYRRGSELQWFRAGARHVRVDRILPGGRLEGIRIYEYVPESGRLAALSYADGAWLRAGLWVPEGLRRFTLSDTGAAPATPARDWNLPVPTQVSAARVAPESLSMQFLYKHIRRLNARGLDSTPYTRAFWSKLLRPAALPFTGLLALALVLGVPRPRAYALKAGLGGLIGIVYYAVDHTVYYLGVVHGLNSLACALAAPGLLVTATLILLPRLRRPGSNIRV